MESGTSILLLQIALGVALAAAAGLRIFLPLLVLSLAARSGLVPLSESFGWIDSAPALTVFAVATVIEVAAYYVPWLDNALDWLGAPVAVAAGVLITASALPEADPLLRWALALIAGGGAAGIVHGATALLRKASSLATGGLANPVLSTAEAGGSLALSVLALAVPLLALALGTVLLVLIVRLARRRRVAPAR